MMFSVRVVAKFLMIERFFSTSCSCFAFFNDSHMKSRFGEKGSFFAFYSSPIPVLHSLIQINLVVVPTDRRLYPRSLPFQILNAVGLSLPLL